MDTSKSTLAAPYRWLYVTGPDPATDRELAPTTGLYRLLQQTYNVTERYVGEGRFDREARTIYVIGHGCCAAHPVQSYALHDHREVAVRDVQIIARNVALRPTGHATTDYAFVTRAVQVPYTLADYVRRLTTGAPPLP